MHLLDCRRLPQLLLHTNGKNTLSRSWCTLFRRIHFLLTNTVEKVNQVPKTREIQHSNHDCIVIYGRSINRRVHS
jgi:hypothetical protein